MAAVKPNLARLYNLEVSTAGVTYTVVSGIQNMKVSKNTKMVDITTFDTEGLDVEMPASFGGTIELEIVETWVTGTTPYTQDVGQTILLGAATDLGLSSRIYWRITHDDSTNYTGNLTGTGYVVIDESGSGNNGEVDMIKGRIVYDARPTASGVFANKFGAT